MCTVIIYSRVQEERPFEFPRSPLQTSRRKNISAQVWTGVLSLSLSLSLSFSLSLSLPSLPFNSPLWGTADAENRSPLQRHHTAIKDSLFHTD